MIVFDTDAVNDLMRPHGSPALRTRLATVPMGEQATTSVTIGELAYGAYKADRPDLYQRAAELLRGVRVLDFDSTAAEKYGRIRADLERGAQRLADPDLRIAAIALANEATLVTGNLKHFARVPDLNAEDWLSEDG